MPFGLLLAALFALAGASVARRRGWPVLLGAVAAGLLPPVGLIAAAMFVADRLRDAVAAQTGQTGQPDQTGQRGPAGPGPAGPRGPFGAAGPSFGAGGGRPEFGPRGRTQPPRPRREALPPPQPLPDSLEQGAVLRALRTHGPMTEAELLAALVDPPSEVRYQLRELQRHAVVVRRHGAYVAR